jgi:hypothetical protein
LNAGGHAWGAWVTPPTQVVRIIMRRLRDAAEADDAASPAHQPAVRNLSEIPAELWPVLKPIEMYPLKPG